MAQKWVQDPRPKSLGVPRTPRNLVNLGNPVPPEFPGPPGFQDSSEPREPRYRHTGTQGPLSTVSSLQLKYHVKDFLVKFRGPTLTRYGGKMGTPPDTPGTLRNKSQYKTFVLCRAKIH